MLPPAPAVEVEIDAIGYLLMKISTTFLNVLGMNPLCDDDDDDLDDDELGSTAVRCLLPVDVALPPSQSPSPSPLVVVSTDGPSNADSNWW